MHVLVGTQKIFMPWLKDATSTKWSLSPDKLGKVLGLSMFPSRLSHHSEEFVAAPRLALSAQESFTTPLTVKETHHNHPTGKLLRHTSSCMAMFYMILQEKWHKIPHHVNYALDLIPTSHFFLTTACLFQPFHKIMRNCGKEGLRRQSGPPLAPQQSSLSAHTHPWQMFTCTVCKDLQQWRF